MAQMQRVIRQKTFANIDEANAFLASADFQAAMQAAPPPVSPLERAQETAYDAWESKPPERYDHARQALDIDERCSDALLILAEQERTWSKQQRALEKAVAAAERAAQDEGWLDGPEPDAEDVYGLLPARAFFRAKVALARFLMDGSYHREARAVYEELLLRDRYDHMGIRYEVMQLYHNDADYEALRRLLDVYAEDESAFLAYERVWLAIVEKAPAKTLGKLARKALRSNTHVPAHLLGLAALCDNEAPYLEVGGEDEAAAYGAIAHRWWIESPSALDWLVTTVNKPEADQKTSRTRRNAE